MIAIAREKAAGTPNVRFSVEPVGTLEAIPDQSFDCVCAFNLLHLVPDPPALVRAVHRVLVPGGHFVTSTACLGGTWLPPYALVLPLMRWFGKAPAVTLLTADQLRALQVEAGFAEIERPDVGDTAPGVFYTARRPS